MKTIEEVICPGWSQEVDLKKRLVVLTFSCSVDLRVALHFDEKWVTFKLVHEVPRQPPIVDVDYMNEYEPYYYGLYLIFAGQKPFREWVADLREEASKSS